MADPAETTVFFVRHAHSDLENRDEELRPLSPAGVSASEDLVRVFGDVPTDAFYSSPYARSVQTIIPLATDRGSEIHLMHDLRERWIGRWIDNFDEFNRRQWDDFTYRLGDGETLQEVQNRNVRALREILGMSGGSTVVVGTHGTALATILNHLDPGFGYREFRALLPVMPYVVKSTFDGTNPVAISEVPLT